MRPIVKPPLPDASFATPPSDLLLQTFGEYCSVSEQPLPCEHSVWHKRLGTEVSLPVSRTHWQDLLLLSENSYLAQLGKSIPSLLFPDEQPLTYTLDGKGPFRYELLTVDVLTLDDGGNVISQNPAEQVIVTGTNGEAQATIEFFALNTQFFVAQDAQFRIPQRAIRSGFDRRVRQRTNTWMIASKFAETWKQSADVASINHEAMQHFIAQGRRLAAATGYWSTWAAALVHHQMPIQTIREVLVMKLLPWEIGPGPHNPYPGTNPRVA